MASGHSAGDLQHTVLEASGHSAGDLQHTVLEASGHSAGDLQHTVLKASGHSVGDLQHTVLKASWTQRVYESKTGMYVMNSCSGSTLCEVHSSQSDFNSLFSINIKSHMRAF